MEENLGYKLRRARELAGLTVDDAIHRALIPRAVVEALEADDFGFFASPLYARSFLKQYGDYVGLDVSPWIDDLVPTAMIDGDSAEAMIELDELPPATREKQKNNGVGGSMAGLWLLVITGGLVWGGMEIFKGFESKHANAATPITESSLNPETIPPRPNKENEQEQEIEESALEPESPKRAIIVREE